jgi:hypothetical protein
MEGGSITNYLEGLIVRNGEKGRPGMGRRFPDSSDLSCFARRAVCTNLKKRKSLAV